MAASSLQLGRAIEAEGNRTGSTATVTITPYALTITHHAR
jgi:hypothetical protein